MDGRELADRVRQHLTARADGLRYRAGFSFADGSVKNGPGGRFFFSPDTVSSLCSLLKQRLPEESDAILRRAESACRHQFDLLGYEGLDYGARIDWHSDRVHGKTAPRKPWHQIHYLDFEQVGDSKVTWELNRHQHLVTLAKAYRLSGDEKFLREILAQWEDWHRQNPYPIGINWASSLEVAFRSLSWIWTYFLLEACPGVPASFKREWLQALSVSGRHIECYLSTYFSPNTHLLGEGVALFFIGVVCPQLSSAKRWRQRGWDIVTREAQAQVQPDGLHFEQSTYYHVYALDFFLHAVLLATVNDLPVPPSFDVTLEKMMDSLYLLSRAGTPPSFGDDDGGRLFDSRRNRALHLVDPLATGAVLFGRGDFKALAGGLREETLWLLGEAGAQEFDRIPVKPSNQASAALPSAGLFFMSGQNSQLVIDAGPHGASSAGHGHADALSVCLNSNGKPLLIDPGTCQYVGEDRRRFRSTHFHNTLCVDGRGQAEPKGPFSWDKIPRAQAEGWMTGQTFDLFVGSHNGFAPMIHRRWVFSLKERFCVVRDLILGQGDHQIDLFWHLSPELEGEGSGYFDQGKKDGLEILVAGDGNWRRERVSGWWSPVYGQKKPSPVLNFSTVSKLPCEFVTLLIPGARPTEGIFTEERLSAEGARARAYRYRSGADDHFVIFGEPRETWSLDSWSSDAEFVYIGRCGERRHWIVCNGTYLETAGKKIVSADAAVLRCEILVHEQKVDSFCSTDSAIVMKDAIREVCTTASNVPVSEGTVS